MEFFLMYLPTSPDCNSEEYCYYLALNTYAYFVDDDGTLYDSDDLSTEDSQDSIKL